VTAFLGYFLIVLLGLILLSAIWMGYERDLAREKKRRRVQRWSRRKQTMSDQQAPFSRGTVHGGPARTRPRATKS